MSKFVILKKRKDFLRAAKDITIVANNVVVQAAHILSDDSNQAARIGFTATKKLGKAHVRNRTKRRLRAVVREIYAEYALPDVDYVLVGRFDTPVCPFKDLRRDVIYAFKRVNKAIRTATANRAAPADEIKNDDKENCSVTD